MRLELNLLFFFLGIVFVWLSGVKLALYADEISDRTKVNKAIIGAFLLALTTSLPEIITTISASLLNNPELAVNNLLGGIPLQTTMLAVVDLLFVKKSTLSYLTPTSSLVLTGVFLLMQIGLIIVAYAYGELFSIAGVGAWPIIFLFLYFFMLYSLKTHTKKKWLPIDLPKNIGKNVAIYKSSLTKKSNLNLGISFIIFGMILLTAGFSVAYFADALSRQLDISSSFIGATLVALATSLPELSTTFSAVKIGAYTMAFANIFGSNMLMIAVFFIADIAYRKGSIIAKLDTISLLSCGVGIIMTALYLWGILQRRQKEFFKMGVDSLLVLLIYIVSLFFLYQLS